MFSSMYNIYITPPHIKIILRKYGNSSLSYRKFNAKCDFSIALIWNQLFNSS